MFWSNYATIVRRGYEITLPKALLKEFKEKHCYLHLIKFNDKPATIQITRRVYDSQSKKYKYTYFGTLKRGLGISKFKDGNPCNFKKSNLEFFE